MQLWPWWRRQWTATDRAAILEAHARHEAAEQDAARQRVLAEGRRWDEQTVIYPIVTYGQQHGHRRPGTPR